MWRLHSDQNSFLHSILKAHYFKNSSVLEAYQGYNPNFSWRSLLGAKSLLLEGLRWGVWNGSSIRVWLDPWLQGAANNAAPSHGSNFDLDLRVADLIFVESGETSMDSHDKEYKAWHVVWHLDGPAKLSHFAWQACKGSMAVKEELFRRHIATDQTCPCCSLVGESVNHVLFDCTKDKEVWASSSFQLLVDNEGSADPFLEKLMWFNSKLDKHDLRT
uniref:Reverse transcriptase zinc-binding domain-containing protein n=1 Tax=Chenopodium quinoa TaxID=63459 RepID=A0A803M913_CHEQI